MDIAYENLMRSSLYFVAEVGVALIACGVVLWLVGKKTKSDANAVVGAIAVIIGICYIACAWISRIIFL